MTKKIMAALLSVLMIFSVVSIAFAAGNPTITVSSTTAKPGDTVTLNVAFSNNPGINTFSLDFDYDTTRLELKDVKLVDGIGGQFAYSKKAVWLNSTDITTNGNFLALTFDVLESAQAGETIVKAEYNVGDIANYDEEDVNFSLVSGKITVEKETAGKGAISVGSASGTPGEIVTVPVYLDKNPGINTFSFGFIYDTERLQLTGVTASPNLGGQFAYSQKAVWLNSSDIKYTGEILSLTFKILDTAEVGDATVSVTYNTGDISNYDEEDVEFNLTAGKIIVEEVVEYGAKASLNKVSGVPGDIVNVYVSLVGDTNVKSMSVSDIVYDREKLTLTNGEWKLTDSVLRDWNAEDEAGVIAFKQNTVQSGKVFLLTFKIKEGLADSTVAVSCKVNITAQDDNGIEQKVETEVVPGTVTIQNVRRGDVNGDNYVDSNDAIQLLYHTLIPERYTINQGGDFNGDDYVNSDDAIHLLYFTLIPERYPLS